jgi:hypothetical protein
LLSFSLVGAMEPPSPVISVVMPCVSLLCLLVDEQARLRLPKHVNETGRHDQSSGVDGALGGDVRVGFADEGDAVTDDADGGVNPRIAAAIHYASIANECVVLLGEERSCDKNEDGE